MKNRILNIFIALLLFASCSDSNKEDTPPIDNTEKKHNYILC